MSKYYIVLFLTLATNLSFGQVVLTQTHNDATIGLDRKAWNGLFNTTQHSDGYAHDFTLPSSTNPCEEIESISIEINFTDYTTNGSCPHTETFINMFYECTTYAGGATCLPNPYLIEEENLPVNLSSATYNYTNPTNGVFNPSTQFDFDFGGNLSVDIIPVSAPGCFSVSNGRISYEYTITVEVTIADTTPNAPTGLECWEMATFNNTTCQWEVTGTQPVAPTGLECWETATFNNTTCAWEVTGTQPVQPTLECWETATFNNTTCQWEVTGTQPVAPTGLECWETATFNNTTCAWEVTGTQPAAPTGLECWETATFDNTTCTWEVTGTQPVQPTLECWETATFNDITCAWEVTGTQPVAPTGLECWETATFNNTTCAWEVTGTQPVQPTLECWETATFNNTTCQWEVTGTQPAVPTGLECWETATFNNTACAWEVTGTQPIQPTLECWETATFNDITCAWEVTGTQSAAPTGLECWEMATFNNTACAWEVTGTQPAAPTGLECWETATFNNTTCVWEVTGTQPAVPTGLECWETAIFNETLCDWEIIGTQPIQTVQEFVDLCQGETIPLVPNSSIANPQYQWDSGAMTQSISVDEAGIYEVEVTDGCLTDIITFNVTEIETPVIESVVSNESSITINVLGASAYQYSLDGVNYQSSNVFYNVPTGLYTIYVRFEDCNFITTQRHFHLYIQKFITPNGDGRNDIFSLNLNNFFSSTEVHIFDRYGKLLYSAVNTNVNWDGTYNGNKLPSSDYWYYIVLDGQKITGHFTLKR